MTEPIAVCDACQVDHEPTPEKIDNRPGLSQIKYRVGTYTTFRQSMLFGIGKGALKGWTTRRDDDFGIALFDMWAYILDILSFYQERIANEAFLSTATQPESLRRLTDLINYRPAPGKAASVYLAFLLQPPTPALLETTLLPRLRVQSVPGPGEKPQKFETEETRLARAAWNQLAPVQFQPQALTTSTTALYLRGRQPSIKPGDMLLLVETAGTAHFDLRPLTGVAFEGGQTVLTWAAALGAAYTAPAAYILRGRAALFGSNAALQPQTFTVTNTYTYTGDKITGATGTVTASPATPADWTFTRPDAAHPVIFLDAEYPRLAAGDFLVLSKTTGTPELYTVTGVTSEGYANYGLSAKVSKVTLDNDTNFAGFYSELRKTTVLFGKQPFDLDDMPVADPLLHGQTVDIVGDQTGLEVGRTLIIQGPVEGTGEVLGETATIAAVNPIGGNTRLTLKTPLAHSYPLATVSIYANVLYATHGETTTEVLGSGDAAQAFQSFTLKKAPVTYVPQAGAPNGAASTLQVRVNDVLWQETPTFYGESPADAAYTAVVREDKRVVTGGDGETGRRFPTGRNNLSATYRVGIGEDGNVKAGVLTTLLDRPAGVRQVLNPLAAEGGANPEAPENVRTNAPNTVRTFGRIVSLSDFEDSARQYAGIAKARAEQFWNGEEQIVRLTVAADGGAAMTVGGTLYTELLADLDSRRDPNRILVLQDYTPSPVVVQAKIYVDVPRFVPELVYEAARQALIDLFAFDHLDLGQTVRLGQVMAALQVDGVVAVDVDRFIFKCPTGLTAGDRAAFYTERRTLGGPDPATLGGDGCPSEGHDVQDFAAALGNELITVESPDADLSVTPVSGIKGTQL